MRGGIGMLFVRWLLRLLPDFDLDLLLLIASISLTISIAWIGIEMANNPPTTDRAKWKYRIMFGVIALSLIGVTYWQGKRNKDEQATIQSESDREKQAIQSQYDKLGQKMDDIGTFFKHPPAGLTKDQVADAVRTMLAPPPKQDSVQSTPTGATPPQSIPSNSSKAPVPPEMLALKAQALTMAAKMDEWADLRLKEAPDVISQTPEDAKKAQALHELIESEWTNQFGGAQGLLALIQIFERDVLKVQMIPVIHACMGHINFMGPGDQGVLRTRKSCASALAAAANQIN
jgi:hypothetical protein